MSLLALLVASYIVAGFAVFRGHRRFFLMFCWIVNSCSCRSTVSQSGGAGSSSFLQALRMEDTSADVIVGSFSRSICE